MIKKIWITIAVVIVIALVGLRLKRVRELSEIAPLVKAPWALEAVKVKRGILEVGFPILATVTTSSEITVMGQISGTILKMGPREGVAVKKGDFLASLDTREVEDNISSLEAKLRAAKETANRAEVEYVREQKLFKEGGSSKSALDERKNAAVSASQNVTALNKSIDALKVKQGFGAIAAPADGVIQARLAEPGDVCVPGHPLYRLLASGGYRIKVKLPQNVIEQTKVGAIMRLRWHDHSLAVPVSRIYPALNDQALGSVEADMDTLPFALPLHARVSGKLIEASVENALIVPAEAILSSHDSSFIFIVQPSDKKGYTLRKKKVQVELDGESEVAITGEVTSEDLVVSAQKAVLLRLQDGDRAILHLDSLTPLVSPSSRIAG